MHITFIYPRFDKFLETYPQLAELPAIAATWLFKMPPALGIPTLIAITPADCTWNVVDQNIEPVNYDVETDCVAISFFTPQAAYAYEIGDEFLRRGKTVVMGGMHPSMIPEDCLPHCCAVCVGEADELWPLIVNDVRNRQLKKVYKADNPPAAEQIASPRSDIFADPSKYDWHASLLSVTRGCPFSCDWCNIPLYQGNTVRLRPIETVVGEIKKLSGKEFYITDDMIMLNRPRLGRYMVDLCERIADFKVNMFLSCSPAMNNDPLFLDALARGGAKSMYTVFASDPFSARFFARHSGVWQRTLDLVKQLEDRGIRFFGSFGVGFDNQDGSQFDAVLEFCHKAAVKTAEFFIATPFPGTPFYKLIEDEHRFITRDWKKFNCANVVFKPKQMSVEALQQGFVDLWREFFKNVNHAEALSMFRQNPENIARSQEYSSAVKDAVLRGVRGGH